MIRRPPGFTRNSDKTLYRYIYLGGVATQNERVAESIEVIRAEFARMRDDGVGEAELADAITYLTGSFPLRLDSNSEIASMLVGMQIAKLGIDYLERRQGLLESNTREDRSEEHTSELTSQAYLVCRARLEKKKE